MNEYTTSLGVRITFNPIGTQLEKLGAPQAGITAPTYEIKTATGVTEHWPVLEKIPATDEEWDTAIAEAAPENVEAIRRYRADLRAAQLKYNQSLMRLILARGINFEMPPGDAWIEDDRWIGLNVPDDPRERKLYYIETHVLGTTSDYREVVRGVFVASDVSEELISQFEAAFQNSVGKAKRDSH